jgi:class 3 adenylate cyclase
MAIEMKRKMKDLQLKWQSQGISVPLEIRMGINSGYCTVGNFGTQQRMDYTVIGTEVNLASRLESVAPPGEILISQSSHDLIRDMIMCRNTGPVKLKGFAEPVQTFQVMDFKQNLGGQQTYFDQQMDGFSIYMDIEKIKNYDQDKVLKTLLTIATRLKNRVN